MASPPKLYSKIIMSYQIEFDQSYTKNGSENDLWQTIILSSDNYMHCSTITWQYASGLPYDATSICLIINIMILYIYIYIYIYISSRAVRHTFACSSESNLNCIKYTHCKINLLLLCIIINFYSYLLMLLTSVYPCVCN